MPVSYSFYSFFINVWQVVLNILHRQCQSVGCTIAGRARVIWLELPLGLGHSSSVLYSFFYSFFINVQQYDVSNTIYLGLLMYGPWNVLVLFWRCQVDVNFFVVIVDSLCYGLWVSAWMSARGGVSRYSEALGRYSHLGSGSQPWSTRSGHALGPVAGVQEAISS